EAREEDGFRTVALEQLIASPQSVPVDVEELSMALQQRAASTIADPVAQVVAEGRGKDPKRNNDGKLQLMFGVREEAREQQHRLAGNRQAGVLTEQHHEHGPVAELGKEPAQMFEEPSAHGERGDKQ